MIPEEVLWALDYCFKTKADLIGDPDFYLGATSFEK